MVEVVTSKSNACFLYWLWFKLPICKIRKTQSGMCLNVPVVLLCQGASHSDSDPWHFRPWATGGKYCVQYHSKQCSVVLGEITYRRQVATANLTTLCLFFNPSLFCQTKLWVTGKPLTPLWQKNASRGKTQCQSVLITIYSNVLMSVLPESKSREQNHWKRLAKIGGKRPWLARSWLGGRQGPGSAVMEKMRAGLDYQGFFLPGVWLSGGSSASCFAFLCFELLC